MKEISSTQFIKIFRERKLLIYPIVLFLLSMMFDEICPKVAAIFFLASLAHIYYASYKVEIKTKVDFYYGIMTILFLSFLLVFLGEYFILGLFSKESNWIVGISWVVLIIFANFAFLRMLWKCKGVDGIGLVDVIISGVIFFVFLEFWLYFCMGLIEAYNWSGDGSGTYFDAIMFFISKGIMVSNLSFESTETTKRVVEYCVINGLNTIVFAGMISCLTNSFWRMFYKEK